MSVVESCVEQCEGAYTCLAMDKCTRPPGNEKVDNQSQLETLTEDLLCFNSVASSKLQILSVRYKFEGGLYKLNPVHEVDEFLT